MDPRKGIRIQEKAQAPRHTDPTKGTWIQEKVHGSTKKVQRVNTRYINNSKGAYIPIKGTWIPKRARHREKPNNMRCGGGPQGVRPLRGGINSRRVYLLNAA